ncbi:MAG: type I methionyl aminopeptidase [Arcicella sp.]|nr:type I methionyl aminopeptidase [Arcicella sp.]
MIFLKTNAELEVIRANGIILGQAHAEVAKIIKPGVTTKELDKVAYEFIKDSKGHPSFLNYNVSGNKFPASLCISINDVVVHGIPSHYQLKDGEIVSIDCGVYKDGFHADSAYTYAIGDVKEDTLKLMRTTKESLYLAIEQAVFGKRVGDIGFAIQDYCENLGFTIVRELVGHGVGKSLHEKPEVANYGKRGDGTKLKENMVIAIEPMVNLGKKAIHQEHDGWTIRTQDRKPSAHYEHTVAVKKGKADILTTFKFIEEVISKSEYIVNI